MFLDWLGMAFTLTGLWLNGKKNPLCWWLWYASNFAWAGHWISVWAGGESLQVGSLVLNAVLFLLNVKGMREWKRTEEAHSPGKPEPAHDPIIDELRRPEPPLDVVEDNRTEVPPRLKSRTIDRRRTPTTKRPTR